MSKRPLIIGLTGTNASGKGTIADYLKRKGFAYYSLSDVIREELKKKKIKITRESLILTGNRLRERFGPAILAKRIITRMTNKNSVVDSIRNTNEVRELRKLKNFTLIAVDAPIGLRFERAKARGRVENATTVEQFRAIEKREASKNAKHQQIDKCTRMADYKIKNEGTKKELDGKIERIIKRIKKS